jgi:hypothetical protein
VFANEIYTRKIYNSPAATGAPNTPGAPGNFVYNFATGGFTYNPAVYNPPIQDFATPFSFDPIADGTKLPERREYALGFDWQFARNLTAGIHGKYRKMLNPIEDSVITDADGNQLLTDTNPNGSAAILWNPHPGRVTYHNQSFNGGGLVTTADSLYPEATNVYKSVDFTLDYKGDRLTFGASYTWSELKGNYEGLVSSSNGQADNNITASFDYYPYVGYGLLPNDRTNVFKFYGSYKFVLGFGDLNLGWNYSFQSGTPISRFDDGSSSTPVLPDIGGYGNAIPQNNKLGNLGRTPDIQQLDIHADLTMKVGTFKVIPSIDVFNVANAQKELTQIQQSTDALGAPQASYQAPSSWQTGRSVRFGVKLQF